MITELLANAGKSGGDMGGAGGGMVNSGGQPQEIMQIPSDCVGMIIGRQGATIQLLQSQSGCRIQMQKDSDATPGSMVRNVQLIGDPNAIMMAKQLIEGKVAENNQGKGMNNMNPMIMGGYGMGMNPMMMGGMMGGSQ